MSLKVSPTVNYSTELKMPPTVRALPKISRGKKKKRNKRTNKLFYIPLHNSSARLQRTRDYLYKNSHQLQNGVCSTRFLSSLRGHFFFNLINQNIMHCDLGDLSGFMDGHNTVSQ